MGAEMVAVPPGGPVVETIVDRRSGRSWSEEVAPFLIGRTVVTAADWAELRGGEVEAAAAELSLVDVSWRDAVTVCNDLSTAEGLTPAYAITQRSVPTRAGWRPHNEPEADDWQVEWDRGADGYRLPTDAEWQVACRAGTAGARYGDLDSIAWHEGNSGGRLPPVGAKSPNPWGLFDMLGGVWEWCWDLYDPQVYGSYRIIRGGGWNDAPWSCRAGVRRKTNPRATFDDLGFRLARSLPT